MTIFRGPGGTGSATSDTDTTEFQEFLVQSQAARDAALAAQSAAELAETNAETAETNAETAATSAISSAASATGSASAAATSATNAANSATSATNSATAAAASAASVNDTNLVHISGTETITGIKTFSQPITGSVTGTSANVTGTVAISNGGTGSITASSARTALGVAIGTDVQAYSPNLSAYASTGIGFRNRIINGDMRIDQRNAGASVTPSGISPFYTVDRFFVVSSQATSRFTAQQNAGSVTPPTGFKNYLGCTVTSAATLAATDEFMVAQRVEGFNIADFGWGSSSAQTVTLSFWVRSSLTGNFGVSVRNVDGTRSYPVLYSISSANSWEYKTITIPGETTGTWGSTNGSGLSVSWGLGIGASASGTPGAWASSNFPGVTGATSVVGTNGATFYITGVQLEAGTVATPFERRDYGRELMMCQRYYERGFTNSLGTVAQITTEGQIAIRFKVTKRAAPTFSVVPGASLSNSVVESGVAFRSPTGFSGTPDTDSVNAVTSGATYSATFRPILLAADVLQVSAEL